MFQSSHKSDYKLPGEFPWGYMVVSRLSGRIYGANKQMSTYYLGSSFNPKSSNINEHFRFGDELKFTDIEKLVTAKKSWCGRAVPMQSSHGIAAVEVMVQEDPENKSHVWVYTLEHPVVDGKLQFSNRSELHLLKTLLDNMLEFVFFRDREGRFILTNKAFQAAIGTAYSGYEVGRMLDEFTTDVGINWVRDIDERVLQSGVPVVNNVSRFQLKKGKKLWLQMSSVPVRDDSGYVVGSVCVARDISDIKHNESKLQLSIKEAKDSSRAMSEFLASMSHEIRTPINGIIGATELCRETQLDDEQKKYLDTSIQCGNTLLSLVNDVLDISKIEAGQLNLEHLEFNPAGILEDVADEFTQIARMKNIEMLVGYDDNLPEAVMGDPIRFKQVIYNLISNAVKFTEKGEVALLASVKKNNPGKSIVEFKVKDTGIGIDPSRIEAIFSSFTQADMSTTRKYGGTGLGLAICKELVELMDGAIKVESVVNRGSSFTITIPFDIVEHTDKKVVPYVPELDGLNVLIVDDNKTNRKIYRDMCIAWGYKPTAVADGFSALEKLENANRLKQPIRLILLDNKMPGLSGLDLASMMESRSEFEDVKIILLSSSFDLSESERVKRLKISRALSKPVRKNVLRNIILETFEVRTSVKSQKSDKELTEEFSDKGSTRQEMVMRILIAEDNPINQRIAETRLKKLGHLVTVVETGSQAVDMIKRRRFDLVLMDVQMPEMDGYDATKKIRNLERDLGIRRTFIVAMTAHAMKGDADTCIEAGMDEYISKPFRVERLREILQEAQCLAAERAKKSISRDGARDISFHQFIAQLSKDDREDVLSAAEVLLDSLPNDITRFHRALGKHDCKAICFQVHTFKGVAGIFNAHLVVRIGNEIEQSCRDNDMKRVYDLCLDFTTSLRELETSVRDVLKRRNESRRYLTPNVFENKQL